MLFRLLIISIYLVDVRKLFMASAVSASKDVDGFHPTNLGALTKLGEDYRKSFRTPSSSLAPQQRETATPSTSTSSAASSSSMKSPPSSPLAARVDGEYPPISLNSLGINAPCTALGLDEEIRSVSNLHSPINDLVCYNPRLTCHCHAGASSSWTVWGSV